ncbi:hypothetical protein HHK36_009590 [Tetracentron sinense]|uniref:PWWP domain-containing protein n=1 Tax=Tetracentron sinense TaxID=13715 RepID=A0A835DL48_TETSI|nr:hypothetical protein HHK36_009590 [Tetracentron sinense]
MEGKCLTTKRNYLNKDGGKESMVDQLRGEVMLGDVVWVRLGGCSWWPAQVVEENTVSLKIKPNNRSVGDVLVRLYGSYDYLYADLMKCRSDFENVNVKFSSTFVPQTSLILKQNNDSYVETFQKALEQIEEARF